MSYRCSDTPLPQPHSSSSLDSSAFFRRIGTGFVLLCHTHRETDKVVQLMRTAPGSIVRRHQRIRISRRLYDVGIEGPAPPLDNPIKSN
jgi:hypothetical protein